MRRAAKVDRNQPAIVEALVNLDRMCAEAMKRIHRYINLSAAQHLYMLRGKVRK